MFYKIIKKIKLLFKNEDLLVLSSSGKTFLSTPYAEERANKELANAIKKFNSKYRIVRK